MTSKSLKTLLKSAGLAALTLLLATGAVAEASTLDCASFQIRDLGFEDLSTLQAKLDGAVWVEIDDLLVACGSPEALGTTGAASHQRWSDLSLDDLFVVRAAHPGSFSAEDHGLALLARGGPFSIVQATSQEARKFLDAGMLPHAPSGGHVGCGRPHVQPLMGRQVLARRSTNLERRGTTVFGPGAMDAVEAVDGARWLADVTTLAGWNRYTHGSEIDSARDWLVTTFDAIPGLQVSTESFEVQGSVVENVLGVLPGTTRPDEWVIVGGHYDSISQNPSSAAPGAEDNASGCAGVLELARVIAPMAPETTMIFMCYSGEEQGLFGSRDHAGQLVTDGDTSKVQLMLNMDMIGYTGDAELDVLLETEPPYAGDLDPFVDAATAFTTLQTVTSLFAFGSDHVPYLDRGMPAILTIENDWDSYGSYHRTTDLPGNVSQDMGYQILRMNAAVLAHVTGAQVTALFENGFETGDTTGWSMVLGR